MVILKGSGKGMLDEFAKFVERPAGHVLIALWIVTMGLVGGIIHITRAEDLVVFGLGVLAGILKAAPDKSANS